MAAASDSWVVLGLRFVTRLLWQVQGVHGEERGEPGA